MSRAARLIFAALLCLHGIGGHLLAQTSLDSDELVRLIASGDTDAKRDALFRIRNFQTAEASRLALPALRDADEIVRATAAAAVVFLTSEEAIAALLPLLDDRSDFVRREAAHALGVVGDVRASAALIRLLERDRVYEVRTAAAGALGPAGGFDAIGPLYTVLRSRPDEDNEFLRRSAARSLGIIAEVARTGRRQVLTPAHFLPARYKPTPGPPLASADLTRFGAAVGRLITILESSAEADDTRREAAFALGAIGDPAARPVLRKHAGAADPYLAEIAREALAKLPN